MNPDQKTIEQLRLDLQELRLQLNEANDTIEAIRTGQVDALIVTNEDEGHQLYTLKTADQTYRVFIEKMTEGAVTTNREGIVLYCNSQFANMVGLPLSQVIGRSFADFIVDADTASYNNLFLDCWLKDCKGELRLKSAEKTLPVQLSLTTLELDGGISLSIILTDLTLQKKNQAELHQKNMELAEMNHALEISNHDLVQFASIASHDLQEPLRKILIFSNLLKDRFSDPGQVSYTYIEKILLSAARMRSLIVDILNYSKLSSDNLEMQFVDMNDILLEISEDMEMSISEKKAKILSENLPVIQVNKGQIRQVFQNIISNALKFMTPDKDPVIKITAASVNERAVDASPDSHGKYYLISIKDNGIGFDQNQAENIFSLFRRLNSKDKFEGTGIGLAIARRIIDKHNGLIYAKSKLGDGAEFFIILPKE